MTNVYTAFIAVSAVGLSLTYRQRTFHQQRLLQTHFIVVSTSITAVAEHVPPGN